MVPTGSAFLSIFPVSGPAFTPSGPPIVMSWQSAPLTVLFVAMDIVVIVSVPLRAFSVNGFQANPHAENTGSRRGRRENIISCRFCRIKTALRIRMSLSCSYLHRKSSIFLRAFRVLCARKSGAAEMAVEALLEDDRFFAVKFSAKFEGAFLKFAPLEGYTADQRTEIAGGMGLLFRVQGAQDHKQIVVVPEGFGNDVALADRLGKFGPTEALDELQAKAEGLGLLAPFVQMVGRG